MKSTDEIRWLVYKGGSGYWRVAEKRVGRTTWAWHSLPTLFASWEAAMHYVENCATVLRQEVPC